MLLPRKGLPGRGALGNGMESYRGFSARLDGMHFNCPAACPTCAMTFSFWKCTLHFKVYFLLKWEGAVNPLSHSEGGTLENFRSFHPLTSIPRTKPCWGTIYRRGMNPIKVLLWKCRIETRERACILTARAHASRAQRHFQMQYPLQSPFTFEIGKGRLPSLGLW